MSKTSDQRLVLLMAKAHHALFRAIDREALAELGVTSAQLGPLMYVAKNPGCVQGDVGRELGINKAGTSKLIRRMEDAELLSRHASKDDARVITLQLGSKAAELLKAAMPRVRAVSRKLSKDFNASELEVISRFLSNTVTAFKE